MDDRLLTVDQVADRLQVGTTFAWTLVRRGTIPSVLLARKARRVPERALAEYIRQLEAEQIPA